VETWNEGMEARDVRDGKYADEDDWSESNEGEDLMWRLIVFGLFRVLVLCQKCV
jgi:hypothetical protein